MIGQADAPPAPLVSEEEVKYLVREGTAQGIFEAAERDLVNRVFQFADTPVRLVMVPRPNILGLDIETPPAEVLMRAARLGHTRLPVFRGSIEDARGVVVIKDLFRCAALDQPVNLERLMHPPLFVPESAPVSAVLRQFQSSRLHQAGGGRVRPGRRSRHHRGSPRGDRGRDPDKHESLRLSPCPASRAVPI